MTLLLPCAVSRGSFERHAWAAEVEDAILDAGSGPDAAASAEVRALRDQAEAIGSFISERLELAVEPQSLFDVSVGGDTAVDIEARRLKALLDELDAEASRTAQRPAKNAPRSRQPIRDARDAGDGREAGVRSIDPQLWEARIELDRARLAFYTLPLARRQELLASHARRKVEAMPPPTESELRAKEADAERQRAVRAAEEARTDAQRLLSEEHIRLLAVENAQSAFEKELEGKRQTIVARQEAALGWQRRARETREKKGASDGTDTIYDALRKELRAARDHLDDALDEIAAGQHRAPAAGADRLGDVPPTIDAGGARAVRERVELATIRLANEEHRIRKDRAAQLLGEVDGLNRERLALLPFLSAAKRDAIIGFGQAGLDQAAAEIRQLTLIVRYHRWTATAWVAAMRRSDPGVRGDLARNALVLFEWLIAFAIFVWARRRIPAFLKRGYEKSAENDRQEHLASPCVTTRTFSFALDVHIPVEWLILALALSWTLPATARALLEVQLITETVRWILGGALVVHVVNAIAGRNALDSLSDQRSSSLRLRSLRLIGRVVVAFGLILALTTRLVGPGTIHEWVLSTCWFASMPVALVLVRWWRETVFRRAERTRRKSRFESWVLANQRGWKSIFAATAGAAYLFAHGAWRAVRSWVSGFSATRRVLAYLFRRELDKLHAECDEQVSDPIPAPAFLALGPETPSASWIETEFDPQIEALAKRVAARKGGVIAIVGQRGMGKTTFLKRLSAMIPGSRIFDAESAERKVESDVFLVDDVQRLIQPAMGGLARFDELLTSAGASNATSIFALDDVVWLFLRRARGARPLFDEVIHLPPWPEEQIVALLRARTEAVGIDPTFSRLLEKLPAGADEIDRHEALERRAASYYRLLWDYAAGNPGVALHMWRRSLGSNAVGEFHVRFFQAPDTADLELLPDQAVFVLRAVLQLAPADPDAIARATMLSAADIADALRHALSRGYVKATDDRYVVTWAWFRPLVLFLQRRHLLVVR